MERVWFLLRRGRQEPPKSKVYANLFCFWEWDSQDPPLFPGLTPIIHISAIDCRLCGGPEYFILLCCQRVKLVLGLKGTKPNSKSDPLTKKQNNYSGSHSPVHRILLHQNRGGGTESLFSEIPTLSCPTPFG